MWATCSTHSTTRFNVFRHLAPLVLAPIVAMSAACSSARRSIESTAVSQSRAPATGSTYSSKAFRVPFDLTVPSWLDAEPSDDASNFVTWHDKIDPDRAVRFLLPVKIYPPGSSNATAVPKDYLSYLLGQTDHGAHFTDTTKTTIDGRPATVVTATTAGSLDGSLGCAEPDTPALDCFGLQPDLVVRIAVIGLEGKTVLVWLRSNSGVAMTPQIDAFNQLLAGLRFSKRAPQVTAASIPLSTPLDGTYTWTITKDDALSASKNSPDLALLPSVFTMTMSMGTWHLVHNDTDGFHDEGGGSYAVRESEVAFKWQGQTLTFVFALDATGAVRLVAKLPMDPGDAFFWATKPWTRTA
jgi:hypothetical protein